jgi:tetratricopeptide (TPR) repeat protein
MPEPDAPPAAAPPTNGSPRARWLAGVGAALVVAGAAYYWWPSPPTPTPVAVAWDDEPDVPVVVTNPGYLGPEACAECHAARVAEFRHTAHARACRTPSDGPMPPGFDPGRGRYATLDPDLRFEMAHAGADYLVTAIQTTPFGERRSASRVDLVYGANKADEVFFTWRDDHLFEMMAVWLHPLDRWANTSYNRYGSGDYLRATTPRCLECHTTWVGHVPGTTNQYRRDGLILGATCERCHGPGKDHAEFHRTHPGQTAGHAVVNPHGLPRERLMEVCTQCHSNSPKLRRPAFSYRPGEVLEEYYRTSASTHPEQDHVANQVQYLRQSKCFQKSDTLTCVTCHDPHKPHAPADAAAGRKSCLKCHEPAACTDRPRLPEAVRDDCVACHMPPRVWMNVHFHTSDDRYVPPIRRSQHRIGVHPTARSEVLLAWHRAQPGEASRAEAARLTEQLVGHWLGEVETCRKEYRFLAAIGAAREALRLNPPEPLRAKALAALKDAVQTQAKADADLIEALHAIDEQRLPTAISVLNRLLDVKPDMAVARSKLGTLYAATGRRDLAVKQLEAVARDDPDNGSGLAMLGWLAYLDDRPAEAADFYRRADQVEPFDAKTNYHWGLSLLRLGRWPEAAGRYRQTVAIDPRHAGGYQGLSHALREQGQAEEAVKAARRAARLTGFEQPDILVTLAEAYAAAGRAPEAAMAAGKALDLDGGQPGGPRFGPVERRRLDDLRKAGGGASR